MRSPNGIQAVLFDFDGTLRHSSPTFHDRLLADAAVLGLQVSAAGRRLSIRWLHYYWAQSPELLADLQTFGEDKDAFWANHNRQMLVALGYGPEMAAAFGPEIQRRMKDDYKPENIVLPDVRPALQALKDAGFCLAVVSNRTNPFDEELEKLELRQYFDFSVAAGVVSSWKPEPVIFFHALERAGARPEQALYVGDNYYADVLGAQGAGIQPVLLDPEGTFPEAVEKTACRVIGAIGDLIETA